MGREDGLISSLVLYSGSHAGDLITQVQFAALEAEMEILATSTDEYVCYFAQQMAALIAWARQEGKPVVLAQPDVQS